MKKSCLVVVGEQSGEEHFLSFFPQLQAKVQAELDFYGVAGSDSAAQGVELIYHLKEFSSMGFSEVLHKIPFYYNAHKELLKQVDQRKTQYAILVDFQGFNLRLAQSLKKKNVNVYYYVAPQAWAWKPWRAKKIAQSVQCLFCFLPFEKSWFQERGVSQVQLVAHPLYRKYAEELKQLKPHSQRDEILFLPGSRKMEVRSLMPVFYDVIKEIKKIKPEFKISLLISPSLDLCELEKYLHLFDHSYHSDQSSQAFQNAKFAVAASGTVTLATGLFQVPTVVCYKVNLFNEYVFYTVVKYTGFISLVNLILADEVFPELTQNLVSAQRIISELKQWFEDEEYLAKTLRQLARLNHLLRGEKEGFCPGEYIANEII